MKKTRLLTEIFLPCHTKSVQKRKNASTPRAKKQAKRAQKRNAYLLFVGVGSVIFLLLVSLLIFAIRIEKRYSYMKTLSNREIATIRLTPTPILNQVILPIRLPILMYHYIEYVTDTNDTIRKSLAILPSTFDAQIKTLKDDGYTFLTASQIPDILQGKRALPKKPIILTFDDGYRDFYTDAYPILKKYHVPATAYIVPGFLDRPNYLFTTQLDEIAKDGLVEIAAHTVNHAYLKGMSESHAFEEIQESKKMLEDQIHKPVVSFAYPYGAFDLATSKLVEKAGFTNAVSTLPGVELDGKNTYFIFRIRPGGRTGETLLTYLKQATFKPY